MTLQQDQIPVLQFLGPLARYGVEIQDKVLFKELSWAISHQCASEYDPKFYRLCETAETIEYPSDFKSCCDDSGGLYSVVLADASALYLINGKVFAFIELEDREFWVAYGMGHADGQTIVVTEVF